MPERKTTLMKSESRLTVRMPDDLRQMVDAVAVYESRKSADIVRVALKHYFHHQGYFDPEFITQLATKERTTR